MAAPNFIPDSFGRAVCAECFANFDVWAQTHACPHTFRKTYEPPKLARPVFEDAPYEGLSDEQINASATPLSDQVLAGVLHGSDDAMCLKCFVGYDSEGQYADCPHEPIEPELATSLNAWHAVAFFLGAMAITAALLWLGGEMAKENQRRGCVDLWAGVSLCHDGPSPVTTSYR